MGREPQKNKLSFMPTHHFLLGQKVVHIKTGIEGLVTERNTRDGKIKVQPADGKAFNLQKPENFTLKAEWQGGSTSLRRPAQTVPSIRNAIPLTTQPVVESFLVQRPVTPSNVPQPISPLRSFPVAGGCSRSYHIQQEPTRTRVTEQPTERPVPQSFPPDKLWLKAQQQLRDMLPDDIPIEYQHCVAPHLFQMEPSWRINWRKKSREKAAKWAEDNAPKRRIVVQKLVYGPNEARNLSADEFEIDYITEYVRIAT